MQIIEETDKVFVQLSQNFVFLFLGVAGDGV